MFLSGGQFEAAFNGCIVPLDPHYVQVREYLGEAYLVKGDMASAKAELQAKHTSTSRSPSPTRRISKAGHW